MGCVDSKHLGRAKRLDDAPGRYIEFCKSTFPSDLNLRGLKIVVDTANGAAYHHCRTCIVNMSWGRRCDSDGQSPERF